MEDAFRQLVKSIEKDEADEELIEKFSQLNDFITEVTEAGIEEISENFAEVGYTFSVRNNLDDLLLELEGNKEEELEEK